MTYSPCVFKGGDLDGKTLRVNLTSPAVIAIEGDPPRNVYYKRESLDTFAFMGDYHRAKAVPAPNAARSTPAPTGRLDESSALGNTSNPQGRARRSHREATE